MSKINCNLPIGFIKREFLRERGVSIDGSSVSYNAIKPSSGACREMDEIIFHEGQSRMKDEVMACQNETQLDNVFSVWARISLKDWIESL